MTDSCILIFCRYPNNNLRRPLPPKSLNKPAAKLELESSQQPVLRNQHLSETDSQADSASVFGEAQLPAISILANSKLEDLCTCPITQELMKDPVLAEASACRQVDSFVEIGGTVKEHIAYTYLRVIGALQLACLHNLPICTRSENSSLRSRCAAVALVKTQCAEMEIIDTCWLKQERCTMSVMQTTHYIVISC